MTEATLTDNIDYLEQVIAKALLEDKDFIVTIIRVFEEDFFDSPVVREIFTFVKQYFEQHKTIPSKDLMINNVPADIREDMRSYLSEIDNMDINIAQHRDWLMEQTDLYLRDKAIKDAIRRSVDVIEDGDNTHEIRNLVEEALCRTLDVDLGLNYFGDLGPRLHRMFTDDTQRVPTYFPVFDEYINGGFPPKTLSVFVAKVHGFKCLSYNSYIYILVDGEEKEIKIGELYEKYINTCINETYLQGNYNMKQKGTKKLDLFINKYGVAEGTERYEKWRTNNSNAQKGTKRNREWYIDKYGEVEGKERYDKKCQNIKNGTKGINGLKWYIDKYGEVEGKERYDKKCQSVSEKGRGTLGYFVNRYGDVEGKERYDQYITKQKHSHSKEGYIEKYGDVEGEIKWKERMYNLKHTTSLEGFVMRHGKEQGIIRWKERQKKWMKSYKKSNFSKVSQEVFWELLNNINDLSNVYFAELDENKQKDNSGKNHEYALDIGDSFIKPDFIINNKIIEFDGDYWHGEARGNQQRDKDRDEKLISLGYEVLRIKERDWKRCPEEVIKECVEFING